MKLYNSIGPNPHVVRMFIHELGLELETVDVDLMAGENRQVDHLTRNPSGQMPTLELDNGNFVSEITVICDYLDEQQGYTDLMGKTSEARAETRMWTRRIDLQIVEPLTNGFRFSEGHDFFKDRLRLIPQAADDLKTLAQERITWLDGQIKDKEYICGDRFSLADIMFYCFLNFGTTVGQPLNDDNKNVVNLYNKIHSRESASA
ncbi:MAG TPA: glutathione S-transferase family protein [SAR86 cluster bacterium]|jgi:glutathione S-transferase|nr:glutathione S-transferase family protein [SAR86 cluster bacterium]|tara:strand:+ start:384 stop:995 length:612 start_codon:yes stop_codon:yes gene_type:complete